MAEPTYQLTVAVVDPDGKQSSMPLSPSTTHDLLAVLDHATHTVDGHHRTAPEFTGALAHVVDTYRIEHVDPHRGRDA